METWLGIFWEVCSVILVVIFGVILYCLGFGRYSVEEAASLDALRRQKLD